MENMLVKMTAEVLHMRCIISIAASAGAVPNPTDAIAIGKPRPPSVTLMT